MLSQRFSTSVGIIVMSTLLLSILGLSVGASHNCPVWREIAPCSCRKELNTQTTLQTTNINCDRMVSYDEVIGLLRNKFTSNDKIVLKIAFSALDDMSTRSFKEMNMTIVNLKLNNDNLSELSPYTFLGLTSVAYLSLSDNAIPGVPERILEKMPHVKTLDLGRNRITSLHDSGLKFLPNLQHLMLAGNMISHMESNSIPSTVIHLHIGRNHIKDMNGTLRHLSGLEWLFLNQNELTSLENQLPMNGYKIKMIHAANNSIERLPQQFKTFTALEHLFLQQNKLTGLEGALSKSRLLQRVQFEQNAIHTLLEDDFTETESLECLILASNYLSSLNNSLLPLRRLRVLNLSRNLFEEFSFQDIRGLRELSYLDLSHNRLSHIFGPAANVVEWENKLTDLMLDHNLLQSLNGALSGLPGLLRLNLSFNKLTRISPDDLIGFDQLRMLDISHNQLTTLEETSKTFLPALEELIASHNYLTILDRDFHGLPVLCWADLSNNQIVALGRDLVSKTRCKVNGAEYGTLKVYLQDNPILCDAALPEIVAAMEINHTRIHGVAHCGPLSEQPVTTKPNGYLGYIPETPSLNVQPIVKTYRQYEPNAEVSPNQHGEERSYQPVVPNNYPMPYINQPPKTNLNHLTGERLYQDEPAKTPQTGFSESLQIKPLEDRHTQYEIAQNNFQKVGQLSTNEAMVEKQLPLPLSVDTTQYTVQNSPQQTVASSVNKNPVEQTSNDQPTGAFNIQSDQSVSNMNSLLRQGRQLNLLASEIEELKVKLQALTAQNNMLATNQNSLKTENVHSNVLAVQATERNVDENTGMH